MPGNAIFIFSVAYRIFIKMNFSNITELQKLDSESIDKEILLMSQQLVELRMKQATRQSFKPHEFKHTKRKLAQLLTLQKQKTTQ